RSAMSLIEGAADCAPSTLTTLKSALRLFISAANLDLSRWLTPRLIFTSLAPEVDSAICCPLRGYPLRTRNAAIRANAPLFSAPLIVMAIMADAAENTGPDTQLARKGTAV